MPGEYITPINVMMTDATKSLLLKDLPLSQRIEEGGFFLGTVRAIAGEQTRYLVEITAVTPAQSSGAGKGHFTFTADSFAAVNQLRAERGQGEELVGWYHTHLFEAGTGLGLSDVDLDLHFATFRRPWQVAGLLNVTKHRRVLRFYGRQDNDMRACTQWIRHERDRYLPAGVGVDDE
jgi:proteasome lid subunit RPN8/RPN11